MPYAMFDLLQVDGRGYSKTKPRRRPAGEDTLPARLSSRPLQPEQIAELHEEVVRHPAQREPERVRFAKVVPVTDEGYGARDRLIRKQSRELELVALRRTQVRVDARRRGQDEQWEVRTRV